MKQITLKTISLIDELAWPTEYHHQCITPDSSALEVFTDFNKVEPQVLDSATPATEAQKAMLQSHVRLKFVVDKNEHLIGIISANDLLERKIIQQVAHHIKRDEVTVADLMQPKRELLALDINEIRDLTIGDIVKVLRDSHQQHCLVQDAADHKIRGIFSASDISRKLKLPIEIHEKSSFYEVFKNVA